MGGTGFPALRTYLWSYTGVRDWTSYPAIGQLPVTAQVTADYPATFLSVGDGQHLNHEYQFNLALPQARTAFQRTLAFLAQVTR